MTRQLYFGCEPGPDVMDLQDALNAVQVAANQASAQGRLAVDGLFDMRTQSRVAEFQKLNGLHADGVVGTATWRALMAALQDIPGLKINRPLGGGGVGLRSVAGKPDPGAGGVGGVDVKGSQGNNAGNGGKGGNSGQDTGGGKGKTGPSAGGGGGKTDATAKLAGQWGTLARAAGGAWAPMAAAKGAGKGGKDGSGPGNGKDGSNGGSKGAGEKTSPGQGAKSGGANDSGGGKSWLGKGGGMVAAAFGQAHWAPAFSGHYKPRPASSKDGSGGKSSSGKGGSGEGGDSGQGKSKGS